MNYFRSRRIDPKTSAPVSVSPDTELSDTAETIYDVAAKHRDVIKTREAKRPSKRSASRGR